jgi:hypothetical protein
MPLRCISLNCVLRVYVGRTNESITGAPDAYHGTVNPGGLAMGGTWVVRERDYTIR